MDYKEFKEITDKLAKWREERHLSLESQEANLIGNVLEEIVEFTRAKDGNERIDALCDMLVFIINATGIKTIERYKLRYTPSEIYDEVLFLIEIASLLKAESGVYRINIIKNIIQLIKEYGYNPYLCMLETIKEISSRTGKWDDDIKKFVKYDGIYVDNIPVLKESMTIEFENDAEIVFSDGVNTRQLVKWYRADYSKCKES